MRRSAAVDDDDDDGGVELYTSCANAYTYPILGLVIIRSAQNTCTTTHTEKE